MRLGTRLPIGTHSLALLACVGFLFLLAAAGFMCTSLIKAYYTSLELMDFSLHDPQQEVQ